MFAVDGRLERVRRVVDWENVPMRTEVLAEDGIVGFNNFTSL